MTLVPNLNHTPTPNLAASVDAPVAVVTPVTFLTIGKLELSLRISCHTFIHTIEQEGEDGKFHSMFDPATWKEHLTVTTLTEILFQSTRHMEPPPNYETIRESLNGATIPIVMTALALSWNSSNTGDPEAKQVFRRGYAEAAA